MHNLKRKSEKHKRFPFKSNKGWEFWSQLYFFYNYMLYILYIMYYIIFLSAFLFLSSIHFFFSFQFSYFLPPFSPLPSWELIYCSLTHCFSSTPAWEERLFSELASGSWRSHISSEGLLLTGWAAGWITLFFHIDLYKKKSKLLL